MKCCELNSGKLRHWITFERNLGEEDDGGGQAIDWQPVAKVRAWVKPISGNEIYRSGRLESNTTHRIYIRYRSGILPGDRINFEGRYMQVKAMLDLEELNRWHEIKAEEGVAT